MGGVAMVGERQTVIEVKDSAPFLCDVLYTVIAMQSPKDYRRNLQKMREVIAKKRT